ncbi:MAG: adenylyl-sulfate kinase [Desulfosporosinus sp.]|nr:adenylyl-sulfate kinase [Desulfosporosinus sp.]
MTYLQEDMKVAIVGPIDYGENGIIGRLMAETVDLAEGKLAEQVEETTINGACNFFKSEKRRYVIINSPEPTEFIKNMVTGELQAEVALLVIDAVEGIQLNSLKQGHLLSMLNVRRVIVLVDKMDLVNFSQLIYEDVVNTYTIFLNELGINPLAYIPVSGRFGETLDASALMPWYQGDTILDALDKCHLEPLQVDKLFRMPVQGVHILTQHEEVRHIITGTVESGMLQVEDEVIFYPSGKKARVHSFEGFAEQKLMKVQAGNPISFTIKEEIYVSRGELVARWTEEKPKVSNRIRVNLFWSGEKPMNMKKTYVLKLGTKKVRVKLEELFGIIDAPSLVWREGGESIEINHVAECILRCDKPLAYDISEHLMATCRFIIVDDFEIAGGGMVREGLDERNLQWHLTTVNRAVREHLNGHQGGVLWFTGLSGAGKSTLANALEKRLYSQEIRTYLLDGDNVRYGLNQDLGFSKDDRAENIRRVAELAKLLTDAGMLVLTTFISPYEKDRQLAREIIGAEDFLEIHVHCSLEECERRDPKGMYAKARRGEIPQFTGISAPYEAPQNPDIIVSTEQECVEEAAERIMSELKARNLI